MSAGLVIGVGNPLRADDGAGPEVAALCRASGPPELEVITTRGEGLDLVSLWSGRRHVLVIDAVQSGAPPGTLHRFDVSRSAVPLSVFGRSTHSVSLAESVELARALGQLPEAIVLYGIEGGDFSLGSPLSEPVRQAIPELAKRILEEMGVVQ